MIATDKIAVKHVAYAAPVTEVEFGWGCRPDGHIIALDLKTIAAVRTEWAGRRSEFGYDVVEDSFAIFLTEDGIAELGKAIEHGRDWFAINNGQLSKFGERS